MSQSLTLELWNITLHKVSSIYFQTPSVDESEKFRYPFVRTHCFCKTNIQKLELL